MLTSKSFFFRIFSKAFLHGNSNKNTEFGVNIDKERLIFVHSFFLKINKPTLKK